MRMLILALAASLGAGAAQAEVTDRSAQGFQITRSVEIAAARATVWSALMNPALWWSSAHSWSGNAANLSIDTVRGCFCEALPNGGSVRHMALVYTDAASLLRLEGALGPLVMTGASGHLAVSLKDAGGKTTVTLTYDVGGYAKGGLAETWATPVDGVLGEQVDRLKRYIEAGGG
jgi:uncharacterized protein YndB with AHSA1/START domain